jgi:hypothetical protein
MDDNAQVITTPTTPEPAATPDNQTGTIGNPPETPPQTPDPAQPPDNQAGTTDDPAKATSTGYYQTRFQETMAQLKQERERAELAERTLAAIRPVAQTQPATMTTAPVEIPLEQKYDLTTVEGFQQYQRELYAKTQSEVARNASEAVAKTYQDIKQNERRQAELEVSSNLYDSWAMANKVSPELQEAGVRYVISRFGSNLPPTVVAEEAMKYIREQAAIQNEQARIAAAANDAAIKAKALAQVTTPAPGGAPGPSGTSITQTEQERRLNEIAPKTDYRRPTTYAT